VREFADALPHLDVGRVRRPEDLSEGEFVKDNTVRTVARLADPAGPDVPGLYVKRFKFRKMRERLKHLLVPTKPRVEWRAGRALQAAGIPTCDVLAMAVSRSRGLPREGFLVSREVQGAETLQAFLQAHPADREVLDELAELTARFVDAGFYHHDYHVGNLLIDPQSPVGQRLSIIDLHSVRCRPPGRRGLLRMLSMLTLSAGGAGVDAEGQHRLVSGFLEARQDHPLSQAERVGWLRSIACARQRQHQAHMRSRTRRCVVESSLFTRERTHEFVVHRRRDVSMDVIQGAIRRHEDAMSAGEDEARIFRRGHRTEVTICPCDNVPDLEATSPTPPEQRLPGRACVKAFKRCTTVERIKDLLRARSRARSAWVAARGLEVRAIPTARPLALLESRDKLKGRPDYLLTEALENDASLHEFARDLLPPPAKRRALGRAVAELLVRMADERVYHPDTKPSNVLIRQTPAGFRLWLVDLERTRFGKRWRRRDWVKALARLDAGLPAQVTLLDRMRCLRICARHRWNARERREVAEAVHAVSLTRRPAWLG